MSLVFSDDPRTAEQQMHAIIFYLTTFGYIDGDFDAKEKAFVKDYIGKLVRSRAESAMKDTDPKVKAEVTQKFTTHFHEVFEGIDQSVKDLFTEAVASNDTQEDFVHTKLKVRCFEIFQEFDRPQQEQLMSTIDELIMADGEVHPAEAKFRAEIAALLEDQSALDLVEDEGNAPRMSVEPTPVSRVVADHPFFGTTEFHYSREKDRLQTQIGADRELLDRVMTLLDQKRAEAKGKLTGKHNVAEFEGQAPFLDGHIYVHPIVPGRKYDILVLGDLHGCYSVLKAALMQSHFFEKVDAFRRDPQNNPQPLLILLGDYIDRGLFSLNGVLRVVLQLFVTAPDFVYVLRGNHEFYIEYKGQMYGGVKPAEAINTLKPHIHDMDVFRHYQKTFEALPNMLFFDRFLFVHGGIAKDRLLKEKFKDLQSLNDPDIRFQMMWSDPSSADVIPADLQDKSARFAFGKLQFKSFMQKVGCHTMVRGHEKVNEGFQRTYDDPHATLITLFSSGGTDNEDLPADSSYRSVTPHVLTILHGPEGTTLKPWAPDYKTYNDPERNAFFRVPPEIEHRKD